MKPKEKKMEMHKLFCLSNLLLESLDTLNPTTPKMVKYREDLIGLCEEMNRNVEDIVYLKTDTEQKVRIVTGILIRANTHIYYLSSCTEESCHYDIEISSEINEVFKLINNN